MDAKRRDVRLKDGLLPRVDAQAKELEKMMVIDRKLDPKDAKYLTADELAQVLIQML